MEKALARYTDIHTHGPAAPGVIRNLDVFEEPQPGYNYSAGIHPWESDGEKALEWFDRMAVHPQVVAIGEAGLDKLRGAAPDIQTRLFVHQARRAEEVAKPLIIHCVRAYGELLGLRRLLKPSQPWIIHGFRGKAALARQLLDAGFCLSFGTQYNPEAYAITPPERLYHETDTAPGG